MHCSRNTVYEVCSGRRDYDKGQGRGELKKRVPRIYAVCVMVGLPVICSIELPLPDAPLLPERTAFDSLHSSRKESNMAIVSSGPPEDSGWNCTPARTRGQKNVKPRRHHPTSAAEMEQGSCGLPQTFLPLSNLVLIPSTEESCSAWQIWPGLGPAFLHQREVPRDATFTIS